MFENVLAATDGNVNLVDAMLSDVPGDKLCAQPGGLKNHAIWQAGHLTFARVSVARDMGQEIDFPAAWNELFRGGSTPTAELSLYPDRQAVLAMLRKSQDAVVRGARSIDPARFDRPHGIESLLKFFPTLGALITGGVFHDGFHLGQLSCWRRAMGLPRMLG